MNVRRSPSLAPLYTARKLDLRVRSFGFVEFIQPLVATIAIEELNGKELHGRVVELKPAITPRERRRKEAEKDWRERLALERESRLMVDDGTAARRREDEEGDKRIESEAKEMQQSTKKSKTSTSEFLSMFGRRMKPKPVVPTDTESE